MKAGTREIMEALKLFLSLRTSAELSRTWTLILKAIMEAKDSGMMPSFNWK